MHKVIKDNTTVVVGRHDGFDMDPGQLLFEGEKDILNKLSPRKSSEWLATRELLSRISNLSQRAACLYDDFGKPYLLGSDKHISVSHSSSWAAAMVSDRSCGVDIQVYSPTVERISKKFLSERELNEIDTLSDHLHQLHLLWGAKECMYKAYGKRKLEFKHHIFILSIDKERCNGIGEIRYEDIHLVYEIHFRILPEAAWVFCMERTPAPQLSVTGV